MFLLKLFQRFIIKHFLVKVIIHFWQHLSKFIVNDQSYEYGHSKYVVSLVSIVKKATINFTTNQSLSHSIITFAATFIKFGWCTHLLTNLIVRSVALEGIRLHLVGQLLCCMLLDSYLFILLLESVIGLIDGSILMIINYFDEDLKF